ncbi:MAG: AtpZ/AtpI family protein [Candidatus Margulisbacteria bacterium]|nr:AtpZ/AtpI family protein [Candidatus Margulisiibacteriota bacterium]
MEIKKDKLSEEKDIKTKANKDAVSLGRSLTLVYQIGFTIILSLLFFLFVGKKLDEWLGTPGIFMIIGIIFGVVGGGYVVYKEIERI